MGWLFEHVRASVALVALDSETFKRLRPEFVKTGLNDPGTAELHEVSSPSQCREILDSQFITSIILNIDAFSPQDVTTFIGDVRTTHPLIAFCLLGKPDSLKEMKGFHPSWRERFKHFLQLSADVNSDDFVHNAGKIRDLFIADVVKTRGLNRYKTTKGGIIQLKAAPPFGFWLTMIAAAIIGLGAAMIPIVADRYFPKNEGVVRGENANPAALPPGEPIPPN